MRDLSRVKAMKLARPFGYRQAEESPASHCRCGCGCTQRAYNPTGSYCSWCEAGQCGEWPGGPNWECPTCDKIRNWDDFQDEEQPPVCTNRYCLRQRGYSDEEIIKIKEQAKLQRSQRQAAAKPDVHTLMLLARHFKLMLQQTKDPAKRHQLEAAIGKLSDSINLLLKQETAEQEERDGPGREQQQEADRFNSKQQYDRKKEQEWLAEWGKGSP